MTIKNEARRIFSSLRDLVQNRVDVLRAKTDVKFQLTQEARMRKRLLAEFKIQMNFFVKESEKLSFFQNQENTIQKNSPSEKELREIEFIVEGAPHQKQVATIVVGGMKNTTDKGIKRAMKSLNLGKFGVKYSLKNPEAVSFLGGKLSHELAAFRDGNIHGTTVNRISSILKRAANSGQSYNKTATLIREQAKAGVFSRSRATLIATREIGIAYEKGKRLPINEFRRVNPEREVEKIWQTVGDDKVTPSHTENESQGWIPIEEIYSGTGDQDPPASDNPRCRCTQSFRIQPLKS